MMSWTQRLSRLSNIIGTDVVADNEERQGNALDEYLVSARVKADGRRDEVEKLRFNDGDLIFAGKLAVGQFGTVDVVRCRLNSSLYARKTIDKRSALRARGQCSPQIERDILVSALEKDTFWAPHILCTFQTESCLKLVMQYADGGNLWDVIESSPQKKVSERDLCWWAPQMVSAIEWCHSQGYVHRDIKPHNFVLTPTSHLLLVDFGSAAPLLPPSPAGVQFVPKEHCLVPCGTCDYISPEILQCHEEALVALELDEEEVSSGDVPEAAIGGYGRETDWWSFGAMLYEMAFGIAPFFANDVGHTYIKIIEHRTSLKFDTSTEISDGCISLFKGVLCDKENRLGRHSVSEIKTHHFFANVDWDKLQQRSPPADLHLPQYASSVLAVDNSAAEAEPGQEGEGGHSVDTEQFTQPFLFSALFRSSKSTSGLLTSQATPQRPSPHLNDALSAFIGFSWGPRLDAFKSSDIAPEAEGDAAPHSILHREPVQLSPQPVSPLQATTNPASAPQSAPTAQTFQTPVRIYMPPNSHAHTFSVPRMGSARRLQGRRPMTDREAMRQLVDCVGLSARKKVLASGKKPVYLQNVSGLLGLKKEVEKFAPIPKKLVIDSRRKDEISTTTSDTDSQPPSPTPRPGSALSRRSGWGGRSTSSLVNGRSTPTLTSTASGTARVGANADSVAPLPHLTDGILSFDEKLRDVERRHSRLMDELALLEEGIVAVSLRLQDE